MPNEVKKTGPGEILSFISENKRWFLLALLAAIILGPNEGKAATEQLINAVRVGRLRITELFNREQKNTNKY